MLATCIHRYLVADLPSSMAGTSQKQRALRKVMSARKNELLSGGGRIVVDLGKLAGHKCYTTTNMYSLWCFLSHDIKCISWPQDSAQPQLHKTVCLAFEGIWAFNDPNSLDT